MGYGYTGSSLGRGVQGGLDDLLTFRVQRRGRFVEKDQFWFADEGARYGDSYKINLHN